MTRTDPPVTTAASPAPWSAGRRAAALLAVLALALGLRVWAHADMAAARDTFAPIIDSEAYLLQSLRIAAGRGLADGVSFQAPLYPYLYGALLRAAGLDQAGQAESSADVPAAVLEQALRLGRAFNLALGVLAVLLVFRVARRLHGDRAALAAGLLAAAYGPAVFHEGFVMKESLSLLVLPLAVLAAARALQAQSEGRGGGGAWLGCGLALGAGGLVRGNLHALAAAAALVLLIRGGAERRLRHGLRDALLLATGALLAVAPMMLRNSLVAGRAVLSTAAGGTAFYLCNHPDNDTGIIQHRSLNRQVPRHEELDWTLEAQARAGRPLSPGEVSEFWLDAALDGIAARPGTWLLAETRKLFLLASRYEAPDNSMPSFGEPVVGLLRWTPVRYGSVLPLACGGLALAWRRRARGAAAGGRTALALLLAAYAASLLLFVVTSRFRLPLAPLLIVTAGYLLGELPALLRAPARGDSLAAGAAVACGLLLSLVSESPLGPLSEQERAGHWAVCLKNRAQVAAERGDLDAARSDLAEASARVRATGIDAPTLHAEAARIERLAARALLGAGPAAAGRVRELQERAAREVQAALRLDARDGLAWKEQGLLLYDTDRFAEAAAALREARAGLPRDRELLQYLALALVQGGQPDGALEPARALIDLDPVDDDGWGLLALACARAGRQAEARAALAQHDLAVTRRRLAGQRPSLPDLPEFQALRAAP